MATFRRTILSPSDASAVGLMAAVSKVLDAPAAFNVPGVSVPFNSGSKELAKLAKNNQYVLGGAVVQQTGVSVRLYLNSTFDNSSGQTPSPIYAVIDVITTNDGSRPSDDIILQLQTAIGKHVVENALIATPMPGDRESANQDAVRKAIQTASLDQIAATNRFFEDLTVEFDQRRRQIDTEAAEMRSKLTGEFAGKEERLAIERAELETRRRELDDRTNTHARRAVVVDLLRTLATRQEGLALPKETRDLRIPLHVLFVAILLSMATGLGWSLYIWGTNNSDAWGAATITSAVKTVAFTFGFLTFAGFYLTWMNRWFDRHAEAQFQNRQFEIDINRASWAVEAALEWKGEHAGEQMPEALLAGITKHLFETGRKDESDYSPMEALASSLLGSASNIRLNSGGTDLTFDRKSIKALKSD